MSELLYRNDDLSDRFGAMTVKELRQGMRRGMFIFPFVLIQFLSVIAMVLEFQMGDVEEFSKMTGLLNPGLFFNSGPFWMVAGGVCVVFMPLAGLALMGQEIEEGNHELLLMTPLTRWRVVRGKFLALWGLCLITFISLVPYLIVRYFIGGIDAWRNIIMALTVITASGIMCAGTIGASAFRTNLQKIVMLMLFLFSMMISWITPMLLIYGVTKGCGIFYHLNAASFFICYTLIGLAMARSGIRLVISHYEVKPSAMMIGLLIVAPIIVSIFTLMTGGFGGFAVLLGMAAVAWSADLTPKAPSWVPVPQSNTPPALDSQNVE